MQEMFPATDEFTHHEPVMTIVRDTLGEKGQDMVPNFHRDVKPSPAAFRQSPDSTVPCHMMDEMAPPSQHAAHDQLVLRDHVVAHTLYAQHVRGAAATATASEYADDMGAAALASGADPGAIPLRHRRRRSRTIYTKLQLDSLEQAFLTNKYPDINSREALADAVDLSEARVQVWFQNRRARERRMERSGSKSPVDRLSPIHQLASTGIPPADNLYFGGASNLHSHTSEPAAREPHGHTGRDDERDVRVLHERDGKCKVLGESDEKAPAISPFMSIEFLSKSSRVKTPKSITSASSSLSSSSSSLSSWLSSRTPNQRLMSADHHHHHQSQQLQNVMPAGYYDYASLLQHHYQMTASCPTTDRIHQIDDVDASLIHHHRRRQHHHGVIAAPDGHSGKGLPVYSSSTTSEEVSSFYTNAMSSKYAVYVGSPLLSTRELPERN